MTFYIEKNKKILFVNEDKQKLINTLAFQPDLKKKDIKETDKEIVYFNGEFVFKEEVEKELLEQKKQEIIKKINNEVYNQITSSYTETKQLNILRDCIKNNENIKKSDELNKMDEFIEKIRTEAKNKKEKINKATTEEEIEAVDIEITEIINNKKK